MNKKLSLFLVFIMLICLVSCSNNTLILNNKEPPKTILVNSGFAVHFIDVGQGDAALVLCDNKAMLIDGGKPKAGDIIYTYLKKRGITHLDYIICSHAKRGY